MQCERETEVLELLDSQTPETRRPALQAHLAACPHCAAVARQWAALDSVLSRHIHPPSLSARFDQRLRERLHKEQTLLTADQKALRLREIEAEYQAGLAQLRKETRRTLLWDGANLAALATLTLIAAWTLKTRWAGLWENLNAFAAAQPILAQSILAAATLLAFLLAAASPCENSRQDLKLVTAEILSYDLFKVLKAKGKDLKMEEPLLGALWRHSGPDHPNNVAPSGDFIEPDIPQYAHGPFAISFATEQSIQDDHYHNQHLEIIFCSGRMTIEYRLLEDTKIETLTLENGGLFIVGPKIVHRLQLGGLTALIEIPSLARDKYDCPLK